MRKPKAPPHQASSVIIPAWRAADSIGRTIESIVNQTHVPSEVLIGVDADINTMCVVMELAKTTKAVTIRPFWFPQHSWPYRIRNTLAIHAVTPTLHFFDADDEMYPTHCEVMALALSATRYMTGYGDMQNGDDKPVRWERGCGVVSILRSAFIRLGGFEPWKCAADTEAQVRWVASGMEKCRPKEPTMLVHKHPGSLTTSQETGYATPIREAYKAEIHRRTTEPVFLSSLAVAECVDLTGQASWEPTVPLGPPIECVEFKEEPPPPEPVETLLVDQCDMDVTYWFYSQMVRIGKANSRKRLDRRTVAAAEEWLRNHTEWAGKV